MPAGEPDLHDDPMLTAYALGELDETESREVRQRILGDDAANAYVRDVRQTADAMRTAFADEPTASDADVATLHVKRADRTLRREAPKTLWRFVNRYSMAAAVLIVGGVVVYAMTETLYAPPADQADMSPRPPVATLIRNTGDLRTPHGYPSEGDDYGAGEYRLDKGTAEFRLSNGKRVKLEGESSIKVDHAGRIVDHTGSVTVTDPADRPPALDALKIPGAPYTADQF